MKKAIFSFVFVLLRWISGIFFLLASLVYFGKHNLSTIGFGLASVILLPPLSNIPSRLLKKSVTREIKIVLLVLFLIIGFKYTPQSITKSKVITVLSPTVAITSPTPLNTLTPSNKPTPNQILYQVTSVVDGDTIKVNINGKVETIRLIGIDTPEVVDPRKPVQCFGKEASSKAKEVLTGKKVKLESDLTQGDKDKYNRLLRYVFLEDGASFNKMMILEGYAHEYTYDLPYKYQKEYKEAEVIARENKKGLWADNVCVTPTIPIPTNTPIQEQIFIPIVPTTPPQTQNSGTYVCNCSKLCSQMASCEEAYYQLNTCGCSKRDGDKDGVPCEDICPGG